MNLIKLLYKDKYYFFLAAQLAFIFILPLIPVKTNLTGIFISASLSIILLLGINIINGNKKIKRASLFVAILFVFLSTIKHISMYKYLFILTFSLFAILLAVILFNVIKMLITTKEVKANLIAGAISGYLIMGICLAFFYSSLNAVNPNFSTLAASDVSFQKLMYFAFVTMTTIGYGDIYPVSPMAQTASFMAGIFSQFYMAVVVAVIVGKLMNSAKNNHFS